MSAECYFASITHFHQTLILLRTELEKADTQWSSHRGSSFLDIVRATRLQAVRAILLSSLDLENSLEICRKHWNFPSIWISSNKIKLWKKAFQNLSDATITWCQAPSSQVDCEKPGGPSKNGSMQQAPAAATLAAELIPWRTRPTKTATGSTGLGESQNFFPHPITNREGKLRFPIWKRIHRIWVLEGGCSHRW